MPKEKIEIKKKTWVENGKIKTSLVLCPFCNQPMFVFSKGKDFFELRCEKDKDVHYFLTNNLCQKK